jgi:hypothetical protein
MSGDEIGVEMGQENVADVEMVLREAKARYWSMSRCGSTTAAVPVSSSPMR